jgi:SAM-dependent methyltransferase
MAADTARIVSTYTAAADHFDALPFWHQFGRRTVARLRLPAGARVLDLCCGTGASALPAAEQVGPTGRVVGVDITAALVQQARAAAAARGLAWAEFHAADVTTLDVAPGSVDAVVSVFGLFFLDDMAGALRRWWSWLAPGGQLAVTVWGQVVLWPGEHFFWEAVRREDATLTHVSPADRLADPGAIEALFAAAGIAAPEVVRERWRMPLATPAAFWPVIMGTSNRGVFDALTAEAQARVRRAVLDRLRDERVEALEMEAIVAIARRSVTEAGSVTKAEITRGD